jgi:hypothetical protein
MDGQLVFPEIDVTEAAPTPVPGAPAPPASVIRFKPRPAATRRPERGRLDGAGLASRLKSDVERMVAHRRRMLSHLMKQSG